MYYCLSLSISYLHMYCNTSILMEQLPHNFSPPQGSIKYFRYMNTYHDSEKFIH